MPVICVFGQNSSQEVIRAISKIMSTPFIKVHLDMGKVKLFDYDVFLVTSAQAEKAHIEKGKHVALSFSKFPSDEVLRVLYRGKHDAKLYHQNFHFDKSIVHSVFTQQSTINPQVQEALRHELSRIRVNDFYDHNTLITEILGNAIEHGIRDLNINWWMYHTIENPRRLRIIFVDMGTGILASYQQAGLPSEFKDYASTELLLAALDGKLGSSTKEPNRGRGLPQINFMVKKNFISNFVLITNNVTLRYINNEYSAVNHIADFTGTFYSWTINKDNFISWQKWLTSQKTTVAL